MFDHQFERFHLRSQIRVEKSLLQTVYMCVRSFTVVREHIDCDVFNHNMCMSRESSIHQATRVFVCSLWCCSVAGFRDRVV